MPTVGVLYTLPWIVVYIRHVQAWCVYMAFHGVSGYMIYFMRGLSAVVRFCDLGQCEGLQYVKRAKGKNPRILFLKAQEKLKSDDFLA